MGGSASAFEFHPDVDSPTTPGEKSVVTDAIEGIEAGQLMEAMEKYVRDGKNKNGPETSLEVTEKDGGLFCHHRFDIPAIFGGGQFDIYTFYKFDMAKNETTLLTYTSTTKLERNEPTSKSYLRVLQDPVRVEFWTVNHETRMHGKVLKNSLEKTLSGMGATATAEYDQPSPGDSSQLCALSAPIEGAPFDADSFLDAYKTWKCDSEGAATLLPDGTFVEEVPLPIDVLGIAAKTYNKQVIKKEESRLFIYEYGPDENLESLKGISHMRVHRDPFRIEQYHEQRPGRLAGEDQKQVIKNFVTGVLGTLQQPSS